MLAGCLALPQGGAAAEPEAQEGVRLIRPATARVQPTYHSAALARVEAHTPATLSRLVLPVVARTDDAGGIPWVKVRLWRRPNGTSGWIPARVTRAEPLPWRIHVSVKRRRATLYRRGKLVRRFRVVVGARRTPTPRVRFFIVERLRLYTSWTHGGWALSTSAHSNTLFRFAGGKGQVALHARGSLSAPLGSAASNGCIRFADRAIAWLARRVPNGTPLDVTR